MTDIRDYSTEHPRWIEGIRLVDALALGRGETDTAIRSANSGIGEIMWRARGEVRVVTRHHLANDLIGLEVELIGEPTVRTRLNPYADEPPRWGDATAEHVAEARRELTRRIGFVMGKA